KMPSAACARESQATLPSWSWAGNSVSRVFGFVALAALIDSIGLVQHGRHDRLLPGTASTSNRPRRDAHLHSSASPSESCGDEMLVDTPICGSSYVRLRDTGHRDRREERRRRTPLAGSARVHESEG